MKTLPNRTTQSPAEDAKDNPKPQQKNKCGYDLCSGACRQENPQTYVKEHQLIPSHLGGKSREVSFGPLPGGLVPANPFASLAQQGFLHSHPEKLGTKKLAEFDAATKGKSLPEHVKKSK
jgi:hypothetical protein